MNMEIMKFKSLLSRKKCYEVDRSSKTDDPGADNQIESKEPCVKCRYIAAFVGSVIFCFLNAFRINFSVGIVAMVNNSAFPGHTKEESESCSWLLLNETSGETKDENDSEVGEFDWSPEIQGYILGSYFITYMTEQIPAGILIERYGCKWFLFWGTTITAMGTLVIPLAARLHFYALIFIQLLRGAGQGLYLPATALLAANWSPKMERGHIYAIMQAGTGIGTSLGSIFSGILCQSSEFGGWRSSFYAFGIAGLILSGAIAYFIHESPHMHPRISRAEFHYIINNQESALPQKRPRPPWGKIFRSIPVYALIIGYFGQFWALSQLQIVHSTFLGTILHYRIKQNGFFTAIPFILMFFSTIISSWISSYLTKRKWISIDRMRKFWHLVSCLGFSACLFGIYVVGCDRTWSIVFSILSMGCLGIGFSGCWIVAPDMSPTFAATLKAIIGTFGSLPSFILPVLVGYLTNEKQTIEQWNKVFFITIGVVMTSGIIFPLFGSVEVQPWNYVEDPLKG